ncbi:uncharacterized protein LOC119300357 [Triticum dicoccoides]|uniref:uncharacterized protein LOC119300357 n=1 Tax=Triticum dicoccoides TaxID=85692 RepID=UPI00188E5A85|nr:uncharacterized protein LOC119300357 [Triticum dicoccoides]
MASSTLEMLAMHVGRVLFHPSGKPGTISISSLWGFDEHVPEEEEVEPDDVVSSGHGVEAFDNDAWKNKRLEWAEGVPYPSRVEFCGDSYSSRRREWTDIRIVRRLQGSRHQERLAARNHFRAMRDSQRAGGSKPTPLFRLAMDNLRDAELVEECIRDCDTPEYLTCPLLGELMIDPVTIATGKTFDRQYLKDWFEKNGHICPVTGQPVSGAIVRNERIRGYLYEWEESKMERITKIITVSCA